MRQSKYLLFLSLIIFVTSCSPAIRSSLSTTRNTLPYDAEVYVFAMDKPVPSDLESLGELHIGDTGFTTKCSYDKVMVQAKLAARKAGANVIKIVKHNRPDLWSSCHRIKAQLYFGKDEASIKNTLESGGVSTETE